MSARITDANVNGALRSLTSALSRSMPGHEVTVTLHLGNREYRITNKLVVTVDSVHITQVWPEATAGYSKREAYNALRLMTAALNLVADVDQ